MRGKHEVDVQRESVEFLEIDVTLDGVVLTSDVSFCVVPTWDRPATWVASEMSNGRTAVLINGPALGKGKFDVYVRYAGATESPIIEAVRVNVV